MKLTKIEIYEIQSFAFRVMTGYVALELSAVAGIHSSDVHASLKQPIAYGLVVRCDTTPATWRWA